MEDRVLAVKRVVSARSARTENLFPVARQEIDFCAPAHLDDRVRETKLMAIGKMSYMMKQQLPWGADDGLKRRRLSGALGRYDA